MKLYICDKYRYCILITTGRKNPKPQLSYIFEMKFGIWYLVYWYPLAEKKPKTSIGNQLWVLRTKLYIWDEIRYCLLITTGRKKTKTSIGNQLWVLWTKLYICDVNRYCILITTGRKKTKNATKLYIENSCMFTVMIIVIYSPQENR